MINIVLYELEISPNTLNIIRTCYATNNKLHIIKPITLICIPHWIKGSGGNHFLSEIPHKIHNSYDDYKKKHGNKNNFYITRYGPKIMVTLN
ncbi:hypothetical protein [Mycoplasma sp. 3398]